MITVGESCPRYYPTPSPSSRRHAARHDYAEPLDHGWLAVVDFRPIAVSAVVVVVPYAFEFSWVGAVTSGSASAFQNLVDGSP